MTHLTGRKQNKKQKEEWETVSLPRVTNKSTAILLNESQSNHISCPQMLLQVKLTAQYNMLKPSINIINVINIIKIKSEQTIIKTKSP